MNRLYLTVTAVMLIATSLVASGKKKASSHPTIANQRKAEYLFMEAQKHKLNDDYDAMFDLLTAAHEIDPDNSAVAYHLGLCLIRMNNSNDDLREKGLALMRMHFEDQPHDLYETTFYSDACMQLGHPQEALYALKTLNERNPNRLELQMRLAEAYSQSGDYRQSNVTLDSIATLFGPAIQITSSKIDNYMAMNDSAGALQEMRVLLATAPGNDGYNLAMSGLFHHYGMNDSATYYLDRAQELAPGNGNIYLARAQYCMMDGDSAGYEQQIYNALTTPQLDVDAKLGVLLNFIRKDLNDEDTTRRTDGLFKILIDQHPHEAKIHQLYSEYLYAKQDVKGAIEQLEYSLDVNPTDAASWRNMMILNMMDDNYAQAVKVSQKAIEYNPDNMDLRRYVAGCYQQMKEYDKSLAAYREALAMADTTDATLLGEIYTGMGDTYSEMGDTLKAIDCYEVAVTHDPYSSGALNNYAYFLAQRGQDLDRAERMAALAVKIDPDNGNFIDTYAWVFFAKKDYPNALRYIKQAVETEDNTHFLEHYGDILWFNGEKEQAVEQWTRALKNDPDNTLLQRKVNDKTYYDSNL